MGSGKNLSILRILITTVPRAERQHDAAPTAGWPPTPAEQWQTLQVTYIFGDSGVGKTRSVMEAYGYDQVYWITDYKHPFDT